MSLNELLLTLREIGSTLTFITAIIGTIFYYKYKHTFLKYFLILLWYIALNEIIGRFLHERSILRNNVILYNVYLLINFSFLLVLFKTYVKKTNHKKWILAFLITYITSISIDVFLKDYFLEIQIIPFIIGGIFIIISIFFYFLEILNTNKVLYVSKNLLFWISVGLLLYFAGKIPIRIIRNYWKEILYFNETRVVEFILGIIMNICFIIGFICSKKDKQY